jgi:hypothetical protein
MNCGSSNLSARTRKEFIVLIDLEQTITIRELIDLARGLKSEHGENAEYDRALLELVTDATHIAQTDRALIADLIGVPKFF